MFRSCHLFFSLSVCRIPLDVPNVAAVSASPGAAFPLASSHGFFCKLIFSQGHKINARLDLKTTQLRPRSGSANTRPNIRRGDFIATQITPFPTSTRRAQFHRHGTPTSANRTALKYVGHSRGHSVLSFRNSSKVDVIQRFICAENHDIVLHRRHKRPTRSGLWMPGMAGSVMRIQRMDSGVQAWGRAEAIAWRV
jgi:hypothetical protein